MRDRQVTQLTLNPESRRRFEEMARGRGLPMSRLVEELIDAEYGTPPHFHLQQAAVQSFVASALAIASAYRTLGKEGAELVRKQATQAAGRLHGPPRERRYVDRAGSDGDSRIDAISEPSRVIERRPIHPSRQAWVGLRLYVALHPTVL